MIKKLYFGQYRHRETMLHSLDPRLKIIYVLVLSILAFLSKSMNDMIVFSSFILLCVLLAKIDVKTIIKGLRSFYFIFAFLFLMYLMFSPNQLRQGLVAIWRFLMFILISMILTFTTPISGLVTAIEKLSSPLKIFGIRPRNIATTVSIAIRFIPVMFVNFERMRESMISRLADFRKMNHIKLVVSLMLHKMLKSASNLSDAMYSRLYNEGIEINKILKLKEYDYVSIVFVALFILLIY
ncbi:energy-coupling factor transporter transmembrane protein EcfT [Candidatus Woesearchaeota archaeon]|nr:energy-coupling factor transporter transmembrane protein EcfT [Candidatus Woesearchaeota archaeon]